MSRSPRVRRWILGGLPVLATFAPPIWSQFVERAEFQRFHQDALREIIRKRNLDPAAVERVRKALEPGSLGTNRLWDKNRAAASLTEELKRGILISSATKALSKSAANRASSFPPANSPKRAWTSWIPYRVSSGASAFWISSVRVAPLPSSRASFRRT